jgi:predicted dehydrogenase
MGQVHARVLASVSAVDVVAIVDPRPEAHAVASELAPDAATYRDVAELASSGAAAAWLIAASTPNHPELVGAAIDAGVHVLCEKPLALDISVAEALGDRAAAAGLVLQVGFWRRFSPPWSVARSLVAAGSIGRPLMLRLAQWDQDPPPPDFCDPAVSGGLAIDCGVHEFDLAEWLTGAEIVRVAGRHLPVVDAAVGASGDVDNLVAVLDLADGAVATVDLSRNARYGEDVRTEILGADGAIFVDLLPSGRTRLADRSGVRVVPESQVDRADFAGVAEQARIFAARTAGAPIDGPGAAASNRAVHVAHRVEEAIRRGVPVAV